MFSVTFTFFLSLPQPPLLFVYTKLEPRLWIGITLLISSGVLFSGLLFSLIPYWLIFWILLYQSVYKHIFYFHSLLYLFILNVIARLTVLKLHDIVIIFNFFKLLVGLESWSTKCNVWKNIYISANYKMDMGLKPDSDTFSFINLGKNHKDLTRIRNAFSKNIL